MSIGIAGLLRMIVRTLGLAIIRSVLTMRIVASSKDLVGGVFPVDMASTLVWSQPSLLN